MGLEPMTSPLPRECSTTELHQRTKLQIRNPFSLTRNRRSFIPYRERQRVRRTRNAKNTSRIQVSC